MKRLSAVAVLAVLLMAACEDATAPDRNQPQVGGLSFQEVPSDAECVGTLPPGGVYQNVIVPEGETCDISLSIITGNIKALAGSTLRAVENSVLGSIQTDKAIRVEINGGSVAGGIGIFDGGSPGRTNYSVQGVRVTRDIHLSKNTGEIRVIGNTLPTGNITVADNMTANTELLIIGNTVAGTIHVIKNRGGAIFIFDNALTDNPLVLTSAVNGNGNIKIEDNDIPPPHTMTVQLNRVPQNLQVFKNTGLGSKTVSGNTASESVQCKENAQPFIGNPNTAPKLEGQCGVPPTPF